MGKYYGLIILTIPIYHYHLALSGVTSVRSKTPNVDYVFIFLCFIIFMDCNNMKCWHAYVGDARPGGSYPMDRWARACFFHRGDDKLIELEENIYRLTLDILDASIDYLRRRFQRHIVGMLSLFSFLLRMVARAIMCYHKHH